MQEGTSSNKYKEKTDNASKTHEIQVIQQDENQIFFKNLYKYYKFLFPYELLFKWLSYASEQSNGTQKIFDQCEDYMRRREISFELNIQGATPYQRHQSFSKPHELQDALIKQRYNDMQESLVQKIDIGAVFDKRPSNTDKTIALEKELVFDIDMTDYDNARTCCQGAKICLQCWNFMKVAGEILYQTLTEDFGFENILWIYSGRRGIHLWVCDQSARLLQNPARKAILEYLQIFSDKENLVLKRQIKLIGNHPLIERAIKISKKLFTQIICVDQDLLIKDPDPNQDLPPDQDQKPKINIKNNIYSHINTYNKEFASKLKTSWDLQIRQGQTSKQLWETLLKLKSQEPEKLYNKPNRIHNIDNELMLSFLYPRLDVAVSTTINHLLKGPFCIHPKSKRLCVPFTYQQFTDFNPLDVPTLQDLVKELDLLDFDKNKKTRDLFTNMGPQIKSLKHYLDIFDNFLNDYTKKTETKTANIDKIASTNSKRDQY